MDSYRAIILSAGQGSRLLPLTANKPKCLLDVGGRTALEWQVETLWASGIKDIVVVTGFREDKVRKHMASLARHGLSLRTRFNPFYKAADNLASCWMVRDEFTAPSLLINGDTLFSRRICTSLIAAPTADILVTIDQKPGYDADDMKTRLDGHYLVDVGKTLDPSLVEGEAIGMIRLSAQGGVALAKSVDREMKEAGGLHKWYLSAVAALARERQVRFHSIVGEVWGEIDDKADLDIAIKLVEIAEFTAAPD